MIEEPTKPPEETGTSQNARAARATRKKKGPSKPRVIDPGIASIHAEAKAKVAEYRKLTASGRILKTILEKRLAQLTPGDKQKLFDELAGSCTAKLV
jgi:hypothetical protein